MTLQIVSKDAETTFQLGEKIGASLCGGEVIELISDLGGGKTTFVKGLARGAGITDTVQSPTFMISRVYASPKFELHHFDFYRLQEAGVVGAELEELLGDPTIVLAIEWGDIVHNVLPEDRLRMTFVLQADGSRLITCVATPATQHLLKGVS
jgi:tRNA threonylcarbamoyladenosine biosynthesis protein TsaE